MIVNKIDNFKKDLREALVALEKKYGVKADIGRASYDSDQFSMTLKVTNASEDGIDVWTQRAINSMPWFKDIFGKEFVDGRHTFKVVGYEFGKTYPIKCVRDDGREFGYKQGIVNDAKFF